MHLAFVSTLYYPRMKGGAEHSLQHHAETLVKMGQQVSVLSLHEGDRVERFNHNGVECHAFPAPNLRQCLDLTKRASAPARAMWHVLDIYNPAAGKLLEGALRQIRPDLVQTENLPGWSCAAWKAIRRTGCAHVQMLHDFQLSCATATRFKNGKNCSVDTCLSCVPFSTLQKRMSQRVEHVVANSRYTRDLHLRLGFFQNARTFDVIYGAVPSLSGTFRSVDALAPLRIGYLGRLHETKGIALLIDAFVAANRPDAVLKIAGTGNADYTAELGMRARGHRVEFLGQTPAAEFLNTIDVLVVPSLWNEPMGRVVIEAAMQGVPVIAAARGGIPELFSEGETGWGFDPQKPEELTERIRGVERAQLVKMREACIRTAEKYAPGPIADQWMSLYTTLVSARRGATPQQTHALVSSPAFNSAR